MLRFEENPLTPYRIPIQVVEAEVKDLVIPGQQEKGAEAGSSTRCVVKILRPESAASQHSKFLRDVQPLLKLSGHPHVLKLYGACLEASPLLVLLQHCPNGDLKQFLSAYSPSRGYSKALYNNTNKEFYKRSSSGLMDFRRCQRTFSFDWHGRLPKAWRRGIRPACATRTWLPAATW